MAGTTRRVFSTVTEAVRYGINDMPAIERVTLCGGDRMECNFNGQNLLPISVAQVHDGVAILRGLIRPSEARNLYGVVELVKPEQELAVFGLTRLARLKNEQAMWHKPITGHVAMITPCTDASTARELPWRASFVSDGSDDPGHMMVSYHGQGSLELYGAPIDGADDHLAALTELPNQWWRPETDLSAA